MVNINSGVKSYFNFSSEKYGHFFFVLFFKHSRPAFPQKMYSKLEDLLAKPTLLNKIH